MGEDRDQDKQKDNALPRQPRTVTSRELLQGCKELLISHGDDIYRLRLTRNDKLILHK
jgi:hemin uptake protein HemP